MCVPRFLWVPFELGRPFGAPHEPDFQRRVLTEALLLLERTDGPVVLEDFPDDAPASNNEAVWACPVSYSPDPNHAATIVDDVLAEIAQLRPWSDVGSPPNSNSKLDLAEMVTHLFLVAEGDLADDAAMLVETTRLVSDDLHSWYLAAVGHQPGSSTSHERTDWFWRETAVARLIGQVATRLSVHENPTVRGFAMRALVPRDYMSHLVDTD